MKNIKALTFDIGGTVFDWKTAVIEAVQTLAQNRQAKVDAETFAMDWRTKKFELLGRLHAGEISGLNADGLLQLGLEELSSSYPQLNLSGEDRHELTQAWHRMKAWPDFPDALVQMRKSYYVAVLTILSLSIAVDCSRLNNTYWDAIMSCEFLGHYKPKAEAYQRGCQLLNFKPEQVMMVASHPLDLLAASKAGMKMAFVKEKMHEPDFPGFSGEIDVNQFDIVAEDFADLANQLS